MASTLPRKGMETQCYIQEAQCVKLQHCFCWIHCPRNESNSQFLTYKALPKFIMSLFWKHFLLFQFLVSILPFILWIALWCLTSLWVVHHFRMEGIIICPIFDELRFCPLLKSTHAHIIYSSLQSQDEVTEIMHHICRSRTVLSAYWSFCLSITLVC